MDQSPASKSASLFDVEKPTPVGDSMKSMFASLFHAKSKGSMVMSSVARQGPISVQKPINPEQPGPPLVHMTTGLSLALDASRAVTNQ